MERRSQPRYEHLDAGPSPATTRNLGVLAMLRMLTEETFTEKGINEATARTIAGSLGPSEDSALAGFVRGDPVSNHELRQEYLPIYEDPDADPAVKRAVDLLGCFVIERENDRSSTIAPAPRVTLHTLLWQTTVETEDYVYNIAIRGDTPHARVLQLPEYLAGLIEKHGDSFIAFLDLPDVDAAAENLEDSFEQFFYGSYATRRELLNDVAEYDELEKAVGKLQERFPAAVSLELTSDDVWDFVEERWDIVEFRDKYHVFTP